MRLSEKNIRIFFRVFFFCLFLRLYLLYYRKDLLSLKNANIILYTLREYYTICMLTAFFFQNMIYFKHIKMFYLRYVRQGA